MMEQRKDWRQKSEIKTSLLRSRSTLLLRLFTMQNESHILSVIIFLVLVNYLVVLTLSLSKVIFTQTLLCPHNRASFKSINENHVPFVCYLGKGES